MKSITKQTILESIGKTYETAKNSHLTQPFFETIDPELSLLSQYFKTSKSQAFFISMVFAFNYKGDSVDLKDLIDYLDCNPMTLLGYNDDFEYLCTLGVFEKKTIGKRYRSEATKEQYSIHEKASEAIRKGLPLPETKKKKIEDVVELLEKLYKLGQQRDEDEISTYHLFLETERLISENTHFPLIEKITQFNFDIEVSQLYLYFIWKTITGNETSDLGAALGGIYDNPSQRMYCMQAFLAGEHLLIKNDLVETVEAIFFNDTEIKLTPTSQQLLADCGVKLFLNKKKNNLMLLPADIIYRELIFDPAEMQQLEILKSLLQEDNYTKTQSRLTEKGLSKGITVLLHGAPGTGKTEIVKQLAKETNREIMKVEISQSKSMWYGESEKKIKRIFTDYKAYSKDCKNTPILLFNEADAIISKRRESGGSSIDQTENTIQNIILEELENFEGILMATTNLANNLDTAFERRFLFKVSFQKPVASIRARIWKSKLPHLDEENGLLLADKFEFSGGEIDNIVRKSEIQEIIYGTPATFTSIWAMCEEEFMIPQKNSIGFSLA